MRKISFQNTGYWKLVFVQHIMLTAFIDISEIQKLHFSIQIFLIIIYFLIISIEIWTNYSFNAKANFSFEHFLTNIAKTIKHFVYACI